jgi:hypothetical protein
MIGQAWKDIILQRITLVEKKGEVKLGFRAAWIENDVAWTWMTSYERVDAV